MYCPQCGAEYVAGVTRCADCLVDLVDGLAGGNEAPVDLVVVFRHGDPGRVALARSILESAEVPFAVRNEQTQDLIGLGRIPAGLNVALGAVEILVDRADEADARAMVEDLERDEIRTERFDDDEDGD